MGFMLFILVVFFVQGGHWAAKVAGSCYISHDL